MENPQTVSTQGEAEVRRVLILSSVRAASESLAQGLQRCWPLRIVAHGAPDDATTCAVAPERPTTLVYDGSTSSELQRLRQVSETLGAPRIVVYGLRDVGEDLRCCARHQVGGLVARDATMSELASAVDAVSDGRYYTSASLIPRLLQLAAEAQKFDEHQLSRLTHRESQVAAMLARGLTYAQIAADLAVSPATVKNHVHNIYRKVRDVGGVQRTRLPGEAPDIPRWAPALLADRLRAEGD